MTYAEMAKKTITVAAACNQEKGPLRMPKNKQLSLQERRNSTTLKKFKKHTEISKVKQPPPPATLIQQRSSLFEQDFNATDSNTEEFFKQPSYAKILKIHTAITRKPKAVVVFGGGGDSSRSSSTDLQSPRAARGLLPFHGGAEIDQLIETDTDCELSDGISEDGKKFQNL